MEAQAAALERIQRDQDEQRRLQVEQQIAKDQQMAEAAQYGEGGYVRYNEESSSGFAKSASKGATKGATKGASKPKSSYHGSGTASDYPGRASDPAAQPAAANRRPAGKGWSGWASNVARAISGTPPTASATAEGPGGYSKPAESKIEVSPLGPLSVYGSVRRRASLNVHTNAGTRKTTMPRHPFTLLAGGEGGRPHRFWRGGRRQLR